jgi:hypothetical protein
LRATPPDFYKQLRAIVEVKGNAQFVASVYMVEAERCADGHELSAGSWRSVRCSPPTHSLFDLIHQIQRQCDEANDDARKYKRWAAKDHDCDLANDVTGLPADSPTKPFPEPHRKEQGQAQRHD